MFVLSNPLDAALESACQSRDLAAARKTLDDGVGAYAVIRLFTRALHNNNPDDVQFMIDLGAVDCALVEPNLYALSYACSMGTDYLARILAAKPEIARRTDLFNGDGYTLLHAACTEPSGINVERLVAAGADPNVRAKGFQRTPLHRAIELNQLGPLRALLRCGADIEIADEHYGDRPLHLAAAESRSVDIVKILIAAGADIEAKDRAGNTPVMKALTNIRQDAVVALVKAGANCDFSTNYPERTPLEFAIKYGLVDATLAFMEVQGESPLAKINGRTLLQHFANNPEAKAKIKDAQRIWKARLVASELDGEWAALKNELPATPAAKRAKTFAL